MHYAKDIREIISSCVVAQRDGATGVKQLSALAAAGVRGRCYWTKKASKAASNPLHLCPLRGATQRPPRGSEFTASSNGSHLFGCHGSTGEPRGCGEVVGGGGGGGGWGKAVGVGQASQNISTGKKRKQHCRLQRQECPPHTAARSLATHTSQQPVFTPDSAPVLALPLCLLLSLWQSGGRRSSRSPPHRKC